MDDFDGEKYEMPFGEYSALLSIADEYFFALAVVAENLDRMAKRKYWDFIITNPFMCRIIKNYMVELSRSISEVMDHLTHFKRRFLKSYRHESVNSTRAMCCRFGCVVRSFLRYYSQLYRLFSNLSFLFNIPLTKFYAASHKLNFLFK